MRPTLPTYVVLPSGSVRVDVNWDMGYEPWVFGVRQLAGIEPQTYLCWKRQVQADLLGNPYSRCFLLGRDELLYRGLIR